MECQRQVVGQISQRKMRGISFLIVLIGFATVQVTSENQPAIRGIRLSEAPLYTSDSDGSFTCLDGLKTLKFSEVNDDYCDCKDGSDEPGTSACPKGRFHCANLGHRMIQIPSSRVNDGICDCCDGSDEYKSEKNCANICYQLEQEEKELRRTQDQLAAAGGAIRGELVSKGQKLKLERENSIKDLFTQKSQYQSLKEEKEQLKIEAERQEAEAIELFKKRSAADVESESLNDDWLEAQNKFYEYDADKNGYIEFTELQKFNLFDKDNDGLVNEEEAKYFLNDREKVNLEEFTALAWPHIKQLTAIAKENKQPSMKENVGEVEKDSEDNEELHNFEGEDSEDDDVKEYSEEDAQEDVEPEKNIEYDGETKHFIDLANEARKNLLDVENEIRDIENKIKDLELQSSKDYGAEEEFSYLEGKCFTYEEREYIYKLCPFDRASQQQRNGGHETTLGRWDQWQSSENNKYAFQKYSQGASCWNGPQRTATIKFQCALEERIISVAEPNRCEYFFVFETPASCIPFKAHSVHDEF